MFSNLKKHFMETQVVLGLFFFWKIRIIMIVPSMHIKLTDIKSNHFKQITHFCDCFQQEWKPHSSIQVILPVL